MKNLKRKIILHVLCHYIFHLASKIYSPTPRKSSRRVSVSMKCPLRQPTQKMTLHPVNLFLGTM